MGSSLVAEPRISHEIETVGSASEPTNAGSITSNQFRTTATGALVTSNLRDIFASATRRVVNLNEDLDVDDIPPSGAAVTKFMEIVANLVTLGRVPSPGQLPYISTMGAGDLSCEWHRNGKKLILTVSPIGTVRLHCVSREAGGALAHDSSEPNGVRELAQAVEWVLA